MPWNKQTKPDGEAAYPTNTPCQFHLKESNHLAGLSSPMGYPASIRKAEAKMFHGQDTGTMAGKRQATRNATEHAAPVSNSHTLNRCKETPVEHRITEAKGFTESM